MSLIVTTKDKMSFTETIVKAFFEGLFMSGDFGGVGNKIRLARVTAGLTQKDFAAKIGIARNYLSVLESGKGKPSYDLLMRLEKEIPGIYLDSIFGTKPVGDTKAIAEGTSKAVSIQDIVREHYDNETSKILAPFSKLEIIEKRSILREINKLLQTTGRGVYERESPDEVVRMMEQFVPKEIAFISADTAKKESK